ncbi:hypothetical protein [Stutzerimonas tarimensis]|uniref:Uncharacterized protein n=1 Tax=Stutzerimonas tarimensis TaxID=1507735 RepID=A0ABV7T2Q5_9GAMM
MRELALVAGGNSPYENVDRDCAVAIAITVATMPLGPYVTALTMANALNSCYPYVDLSGTDYNDAAGTNYN